MNHHLNTIGSHRFDEPLKPDYHQRFRERFPVLPDEGLGTALLAFIDEVEDEAFSRGNLTGYRNGAQFARAALTDEIAGKEWHDGYKAGKEDGANNARVALIEKVEGMRWNPEGLTRHMRTEELKDKTRHEKPEDRSVLTDYLLSRCEDPEIIRKAAEEGAEDQNRQLAYAKGYAQGRFDEQAERSSREQPKAHTTHLHYANGLEEGRKREHRRLRRTIGEMKKAPRGNAEEMRFLIAYNQALEDLLSRLEA